MTSLLTEGSSPAATTSRCSRRRLEDVGDAARDLRTRLLARPEHVAVGAVRDAQPGGRRRARARFRHHSLRGRVLPDVAGLHAAVADADRPDAASFAERRRSRAVVALPGSAVRRHLERAGAPAVRRSTSSARCCTASTPTRSRSARRPTTTCCSSAGSRKARACCRRSRSPRRVGMRLILAAAEDDYYRENDRAARRRHRRSCTSARPTSRPR